ncbi:MAG: methyltransferase domain-containing protein [Prolixibacteraceae bacterium]|jgi:ubiquinone/menaquinone biosynthesis C-methylase UbiE|nr:methyltransferase domain-containing protein [Prolixibacteraceae bacterium]
MNIDIHSFLIKPPIHLAMKSLQYSEPRKIAVYMQQAIRPISKRYYYSNYVNELPLNSSDNILEIGSGIGAMAELLAQKVPDGQLTCVDVSDNYISVASRNLRIYSNILIQKGQLNSLRLKQQLFDSIILHFVLHDIPVSSREIIISQMFDLLRPGGKVYIREPLKESHGMPTTEISKLFNEAGFYPLFQEESKIRIVGEVVTACYAKISTIRLFLT